MKSERTNFIFSILYLLLLGRVFHSLWLPPLVSCPSTWQTHKQTHTESLLLCFPTHVNLMVMWGFTSHLKPACVSSVDPPALRKQPADPAIPSAVSHRFSVSLDRVKTSNHDDLSQIQVLSRTAYRRKKALMVIKYVKRRRNAAWMQESRPRLLHYPLCHILFWVAS